MTEQTMQELANKPCIFTRISWFTPFVTLALIVGLGFYLFGTGQAQAAGEAKPPRPQEWTFDGPFGTFDRDALRRGYQVYKEVCAACHSMRLVHFRNLGERGGPEFTEDEVKAIAAEYEVVDGPDSEGDMFDRPARPSDRFPSPFENDNAAKSANGGALPPDMSVIAKARGGGVDYLYSLLTGYKEPPADKEVGAGQYYNPYMPGSLIAMAPPLSEDIVEYADGTPATLHQTAHDVTAFLMWAAEPKLEERKQLGFQVMIFLIILAGLLYFTMRKVWADQH